MNSTGFGFDSHRFVDGKPLKLGGVLVEHPQGLLGHSDGDAALHALIDAMLGAAGLGDIGEHFPDTEARWKDADSAMLLGEAVGLLLQMGWSVVNCDITIICQAPRLGAYKMAMRERIADQLGLDPQAVSVKAKTAEGMGFCGAGEGLAAFAVVLLESLGD
jgi:2-C-methyl-D-erythritol 2,4-cyclodiphosphate synthase